MKSINQFILLSLLSALLTSCSNTCKNCTPDLLFKQIGFSPQPYINTQYRAVYVLGDSLSDTGAIIGVFNNMLSFVKQEFDTLRWIDNIVNSGEVGDVVTSRRLPTITKVILYFTLFGCKK